MFNIGTILYTAFKGKFVGVDEFGNKYYESKRVAYHGRKKRWVVYKGVSEPSKVPPQWHSWLHYTSDTPLDSSKYNWEKQHTPNLTGTELAYFPPGHEKKGGQRDKATGDYEAWKP